MAEVLLKNAPPKASDLFNKGLGAFERGNLGYAMDLFGSSLEVCPGLLQARKFLRAAEIKQFKEKKGGAITHMISTITGLPQYLKAMSLLKSGKSAAAVVVAEKLLRIDPLSIRFITMFAEATKMDHLPEAGVQTLEIVRDHYPDDVAVLKELGLLYQAVGRTKDARECYERLCELRPGDPQLVRLLKDAMAIESMRTDGWVESSEKGSSYREMIRDTKETQLLEQESKAVKTERDVDALIQAALEKITTEPGNINHYRSLARLYVQKNMFAEALDTLQKAMKISSGDPEVSAALSRVRLQQYDYEIMDLRNSGDEAAAQEKENEKSQFAFGDLQDRVQRYPNDLALRHDLGIMLYDNDYINEAIQQLQMAQRSPQHRVKSLYYLGLCFKGKQQYDLASEQLAQAVSDLVKMDDTKKDIIYELGEIAEAMGDAKKAIGYYKQIYQVDIGFKDVANKVEKAYQG